MKKRILALLSLLTVLLGGVAFAYVADGNASKPRAIDNAPAYFPYREYQLVRYGADGANDVQLSAGDVVVGDTTSADGVTVGLVGTVGSTDAVKGVVVSATIPTCDVLGTTVSTDFGRRNWGYIQVKGFCSVVNVASGPVVGGTLVASQTTPRYATAANGGDIGQRSLGFAYAASEQGQSKVEIDK